RNCPPLTTGIEPLLIDQFIGMLRHRKSNGKAIATTSFTPKHFRVNSVLDPSAWLRNARCRRAARRWHFRDGLGRLFSLDGTWEMRSSVYRSWTRGSVWAWAGVRLILTGLLRGMASGEEGEFPGIEVLEQRVGNGTAFSLRNPQLADLTVSLDFSV